MMMLEDRFFEQEWIQELSNEDFRMLMYLLHFASKKTGIVELNMRFINFAANTGKNYTKEDVLSRFGSMIQLIPGKGSTAIFHDYIALNWAKGGKPIDTVKNPLFKSIVSELANYGMTMQDVNAMSKHKVEVIEDNAPRIAKEVIQVAKETESPSPKPVAEKKPSVAKSIYDEMFGRFWSAYPSECPRKTDKKKCLARFCTIMKDSKNPETLFDAMMNGLEQWKKCSTWNKDEGQFIRAPLVWLNNENWKDCPMPTANTEKPKIVERPISKSDWLLCSERCAMFRDGRCLCGMKIPPTRMSPVRPPEECAKFKERQ